MNETMTACPKCSLPKEEYAWHCDGCGYEFRQDYDAVRAELRAQLQRGRAALWVTALVGVAMLAGLVYLAMHGAIFISVPLMFALVGYIGRAVHKISVVRGHLELLDRRHPSLPTATARSAGG